MKKNILNIVLIVCILASSFAAIAQKEQEKSRLNLGQAPKKLTETNFLLFNPAKSSNTTVNLKASYSKYYRDRLLTQKPVENKVVALPEPRVEKITISSIYPNPASQYATIDYTVQYNFTTASVSFYNLLGKQIGEFELSKNSDKLRVNVSNWDSGMYMYKLTIDGRKVSTKKLLVNRN